MVEKMEIQQGFKITGLGCFPIDWKLKLLPEIIWFQEGPGLRKWQFKSSGLKVINVTNLEESGFLNLDSTRRHISWEEFENMYKHFLIDEGDVVIASSGNSYCKTAIVRKRDLPLLMNTSVIRFKALKDLVYGYMLTYLTSN
jgi:type I restriction enzyme S subunit